MSHSNQTVALQPSDPYPHLDQNFNPKWRR